MALYCSLGGRLRMPAVLLCLGSTFMRLAMPVAALPEAFIDLDELFDDDDVEVVSLMQTSVSVSSGHERTVAVSRPEAQRSCTSPSSCEDDLFDDIALGDGVALFQTQVSVQSVSTTEIADEHESDVFSL
eukprot:TRINITY_DN12405_c0_g1_i1.p2 TRINITY_DN12405_c0_g1~~TRINITY_DN12405_c0_g1_i1.p2  ORF type:complete len:130 (-),score=31.48 TRINITY_DN12405_c0_g1_i1:30-419(-)